MTTFAPGGPPAASHEMSEPPMPNEPTIWQAAAVATCRSPAGPVPDSPKNSSSATMPPKLIWIITSISDCVLVKRSSSSEWASRPSTAPRLMIESTSSLRLLPTR